MNWHFATTVHHSVKPTKLTSELTSPSPDLTTTPRAGPDLRTLARGWVANPMDFRAEFDTGYWSELIANASAKPSVVMKPANLPP